MEKIILKCKKCEKIFKSAYGFECHMKKKIPCNQVLTCTKCNKVFAKKSDLTRHIARKTSCELVQGDMIGVIPDNKCQFCGRVMRDKYILGKHFNTCKVKNGGIQLLLEKLVKEKEAVDKRIAELKCKVNAVAVAPVVAH